MPESFDRVFAASRSRRSGIASGIETAGEAIANAITERRNIQELSKANAFLLGKAGIDVAGVDARVLSRLNPGDILDIIAAKSGGIPLDQLQAAFPSEGPPAKALGQAGPPALGGGPPATSGLSSAVLESLSVPIQGGGTATVRRRPSEAELERESQRKIQEAVEQKKLTEAVPSRIETQASKTGLTELEKVKTTLGFKPTGEGGRLRGGLLRTSLLTLRPVAKEQLLRQFGRVASQLALLRTGRAGEKVQKADILKEFNIAPSLFNLSPSVIVESLTAMENELRSFQGVSENILSITPVEE